MNNRQFLANLGQRIKEFRLAKNMSQTDLASKCGFGKATMSRLETGKLNSTIGTLKKIANALKIQLSDMFADL